MDGENASSPMKLLFYFTPMRDLQHFQRDGTNLEVDPNEILHNNKHSREFKKHRPTSISLNMATYAQQANSGKDSGSNGGNHSYSNNNNHNNNSSDGSKKEEFRKYLEKTGVLETLTKVLVGLYEEPERPSNAIEYIKRYMGAPKNVDVEGLKRENEQLKRQLAALSAELAEKNQSSST